jgi:hypothetical protein
MVRVTIRHGPRAATVWAGPPCSQPAVAAGPYHGILPRGLMELELEPPLWPALAPVLDGVLAGGRDPCPVAGLTSRRVRALAGAARAAGVRSYRDSAAAALEYALTVTGATSASEIDLWSVREGHTASVWRLRVDERVIALNVARDDMAAAELRETGVELRDLHRHDPAGVVEVLDLTPGVLACAWVNGRELHVVDRGDGAGQFIAIKQFAPTADGRQLAVAVRSGVPSSDAIWARWLEALVRQTTTCANGMLSRPRVEACEGDLVLVDERPVLVALSPGPVTTDRADWQRDLLDLSSGERDPVLRWGNPAAARAAFERALAGLAEPRVGAEWAR